jgi:membrane associated rhomboid family serine protease
MFDNLFRNITPITKNIIIINVIVFILANTLFPKMYDYLVVYFPLAPQFKSWQIITHMFMHGGIMHIAFNMLTLASFGPLLERFLGEKKYIMLYFLSGLGAFALNSLWIYYETISTGHFENVAMLGASGAIFGVVAAFTALYPNAEMMIMFIPFPIKAKILLPIVIIGSIYLGINNIGGVAHFAHIGGAIVGYILIKIWGRNRYRIN